MASVKASLTLSGAEGEICTHGLQLTRLST